MKVKIIFNFIKKNTGDVKFFHMNKNIVLKVLE